MTEDKAFKRWAARKLAEKDEDIAALNGLIRAYQTNPLSDAQRHNRYALKAIRLYLAYSGGYTAEEIAATVAGLIPKDLGPKL